jgi:crotonobetainyl-CoA:carnitine CoA-transferase CaiB-like acyl-CoA transferase
MVDVALYEAVFNLMESLVPEYDHAGVVRERTGGGLPGIVPSNTYTTSDGDNLVIAGNGDAIFKRLMLAIGRDDMANDPQLTRNDGRVPRTAEIDVKFTPCAICSRTRNFWPDRCLNNIISLTGHPSSCRQLRPKCQSHQVRLVGWDRP